MTSQEISTEKNSKKKRIIIILIFLFALIAGTIAFLFINTPKEVVVTPEPQPPVVIEPTAEPVAEEFNILIDGVSYTNFKQLQEFENSPEWVTPAITCVENLIPSTKPEEFYTSWESIDPTWLGHKEGNTYVNGSKNCGEFFVSPETYNAYNTAIDNSVNTGAPLPAEFNNPLTQATLENPYAPRIGYFNSFTFTDYIKNVVNSKNANTGSSFEVVSLTPEQAYFEGINRFNFNNFTTPPETLDEIVSWLKVSNGTQTDENGNTVEMPPLLVTPEAETQFREGWAYAQTISKV